MRVKQKPQARGACGFLGEKYYEKLYVLLAYGLMKKERKSPYFSGGI
ncbi:hypothetical protein [Ligilactobacillus equi]|nr:hypothetical protein [Ligilactobacillus equi]